MLNLKKNKFLQHYVDLYTVKIIIIKLIIIIIAVLITILPAFLIREAILLKTTDEFNIMGNFLVGQIAFNPGTAFSSFKKNPELAASLQIFLFIAICLIFFSNKYIIADIGIAVIAFAGLANIIDREIPETFMDVDYNNHIVDYVRFGFIRNSAIFNWQDSLLIMGSIWVWIYIIIHIILKVRENRKSYEEKNNLSEKK